MADFYTNHIAGKRVILQDFIGISSSTGSGKRIQRAINILIKEAKKYYKQKYTIKEEQKELCNEESKECHQIDIPAEIYEGFQKYQQASRCKAGVFRNKNLKKLSDNILIVENMLLVQERSLEEVAKWLGMPVKAFKLTIDRYFRSKCLNKIKYQQEVSGKLSRLLKLKEICQVFMNRKKGR